MDIANYSSDSRVVIKNAKEVAAAFRHPEIEVEHLLIAAVRHDSSDVESILNQLGKSQAFVEAMIEEYLKDQPRKSTARENLVTSPGVQTVLAQAIEEKARLYDALVEPEHIFIAAFDPKSTLSGYVRDKIDLTKEDIYRAIAESKSVEEIASAAVTPEGAPEGEKKKEVPGTLKYCIDQTNLAAAGEFDPVIGREREIQQVVQILLRRRKNSPVLVGGAGVGKTAIVEGFAQAIIDKKVPKSLQDVKIMEVDMGALIAGAKYKGEFEERFKTLISDVVKTGGRIVLFIDEVHSIVGAGSSGGGDAANLIKPALARGQIRLIGATTQEEYTKYLEKDKALDRRFERIVIEEPGIDDSVRILEGVVDKYAEHHKITYTEEALTGAVKFAKRYLSERNLPDVALDIIDEAASEFAVKSEMATTIIPELSDQIKQIETYLADCKGKNPDDGGEGFDKLQKAHDEFSRNIDMLQESWGHRAELPQAEED
jgi:ATP-dependent Clp protease ATP-binding subunit ClpA